jgi:hypothetical protein
MQRTGTSSSCPSGPARQAAGRHLVGQPDAVGGLVQGVAARVHGRGVHRQADGRLAARAHRGRGRLGGGRTRLTRTSRGTPPPAPRPRPAPGRAREFIGHKATPTILEGPLRRRGPALPSLPAPDPELASARVVWRRSEPSRTLRCGLGSGSQVAGHRGGLDLRMGSAESSSTWRMVARGRADRNQARRDRGRSPGSREEAGEALERLAPAHLHRRRRLAEGSEFCVRGVEGRRA